MDCGPGVWFKDLEVAELSRPGVLLLDRGFKLEFRPRFKLDAKLRFKLEFKDMFVWFDLEV